MINIIASEPKNKYTSTVAIKGRVLNRYASMFKYSESPANTPPKTPLLFDFVNLFFAKTSPQIEEFCLIKRFGFRENN
jgi:hypothetical protein